MPGSPFFPRHCAALLVLAHGSLAVSLAAAETIATIEVRETAGIRRFHYPATARLRLTNSRPELADLAVVLDGQPIEAQLTLLPEAELGSGGIAVDFEASLLPLTSRRLEIVRRTRAIQPPRGLVLSESADRIGIAGSGELAWTLTHASGRPVDGFRVKDKNFLGAGGGELTLRGRDGSTRRLSGRNRIQVLKRGPLACLVRFESDEDLGGSSCRSTVEVEIPRAKSWARIHWRLEDASHAVQALSIVLDLSLAGEPVLVDFGATSFVYATLAPRQVARFEAGGTTPAAWRVLRGEAGKTLEPHVQGLADGPPARVEGWAHVWDQTRCTAVAVAGFGRDSHDTIEAHATGRLAITREFTARGDASSPVKKELLLWIHFVDSPPHVGAATSPQSMLAPLEVRTSEPGRP